MAISPISLTLELEKRWWFGAAFTVGWIACFLGLMTETRVERFASFLVNHGMVLKVK